MKRVGFIGLGNMGRGMCKNLCLKGNDVCAYDANPAALKAFEGMAKLAGSHEEVFDRSDYIFLSLPNSNVIEGIVRPLIGERLRGKIIVDVSTSYPMSTRALYKDLKAVGANLVDSPLIAGPEEAEQGKLIAVIAGDREAVEQVEDLIQCYCVSYQYVGEVGSGHLIKLAQNFAGLTQALIYAQLYPIMDKYGVSPQKMYDSLNNDVYSNWVFQFYSKKYLEKNYKMDFALGLGLKDLTYMKRLYEDANIPAFILDGALDLCRVALKEGQQHGETVDFSYPGKTMYEYVGIE